MTKNTDWRTQNRKKDGSIKTIKGNLYARIQYIDEATGKRKERLRRAKNRTHAWNLVKQMRGELQDNGQSALESDKITFDQLADKYDKIYLNTGVLPAAPRPRLPFLLPPKYDSSTSISPLKNSPASSSKWTLIILRKRSK